MTTPTNPISLYPLLLDYLGRDSEDRTVIELLENTLATYGKPDFDDEDERDVYDWVLVRRKGVEIGFVDRAYHEGKPYYAWYSEGAILAQVYFYCGFDDVAPYVGELPNKITWQDDRTTVLAKMQTSIGFRRQSSLSDVWEFDDYLLTMNYNEETQLVERIVFHLKNPPLPTPKDIAPPDFITLAKHLYQPITNPDFINLWQGHLDDDALTEANEDDEIDLTESYGLKLHIANQTGEPLLQGISFYANREMDSVGWQGLLPFDIRFDDSPKVLLNKINQTPREIDVDVNDGYAVWDFDDFSMHVLFSTFKNEILRVQISSPIFD